MSTTWKWCSRMEEAERFVATHKRWPSRQDPSEAKLRDWLLRQRTLAKYGVLTKWQAEKVESINSIEAGRPHMRGESMSKNRQERENLFDSTWHRHFLAADAFYRENGHMLAKYGSQLFTWIRYQRRLWVNNKLPQEREFLLRKAEWAAWVFSPIEAKASYTDKAWSLKLAEATEVLRGQESSEQERKNVKAWIIRQKEKADRGILEADQVESLQTLFPDGMADVTSVHRPQMQKWVNHFNAVRLHVAETGLLPSFQHDEYFWVLRQMKAAAAGRLDTWQLEALCGIGFEFNAEGALVFKPSVDVSDTYRRSLISADKAHSLEKMLQRLERFVSEYGRMPENTKREETLFRWASLQGDREELTDEQKERFFALIPNESDDEWNASFCVFSQHICAGESLLDLSREPKVLFWWLKQKYLIKIGVFDQWKRERFHAQGMQLMEKKKFVVRGTDKTKGVVNYSAIE